MSNNKKLAQELEIIRKEIPISIRDQAKDIGIAYSTLLYLNDDNKTLKLKVVRAIKAYLSKYNSIKI